MGIIKENITTIILIIVIIFILIGTGIFCYKIIETSEHQTEVKTSEEQYKTNSNNNNIGSVWNGSTGEASVDNDIFNYIDMSKYYLNINNGNVAKIYNKMLDTLGKQKYIVETSNGSDCIKSTIDFNKMCFLCEYNECYECWAYSGGIEKRFKYYYSTGKFEKDSEKSLYMKSDADFAVFAIDVKISDDDYKWNYNYNENVSRKGYFCYEIIANWDGSYVMNYSGEYKKWDGIKKLYIDMNTYKLIEIESTFYANDTQGYLTYSKFYEYSDGQLEIPKEAQEFLKIY